MTKYKQPKWKPYMKKYKRYKELTKEEQRELLYEILRTSPGESQGRFIAELTNEEVNDESKI